MNEENLKFNINAIYLATEGEGVHIGTPQVFVRFQGCSIGCVNCDSVDTWNFSDGIDLSLESVLSEVKKVSINEKIKRVSITGGDPLHPSHTKEVLELCKVLKKKGYYINIEAAGTRVVPEIFDLVDYISFDFKTPSTQVKTNPNLILKLVDSYNGKFQVKSVIENREDFEATLEAYNYLDRNSGQLDFPWCLTPAYNLDDTKVPLSRIDSITDWNYSTGAKFKMILQQHKVIHGPLKKRI